MNLLEKLKAGKSATKTVVLEGTTFGFRLLSENDYLESGLAVIDLFKGKKIDDVNMANAELFEAEKSTQLLVRALIDPETGEPVADSPMQMRNALSREHKAWLIEQYLAFEKDFSPLAGRNMSDEEFHAMLDTLKKTPHEVNLSDLNSDTLSRLITALVYPQAI